MNTHHGGNPGPLLERIFLRIQEERMRDVPLLNPRLRVEAVGFRPREDGWCGILITPWFMNLIQLPGAGADCAHLRVGASLRREFPAGTVESIVAHETELGHYLTCSLYSPMFEFPTQSHAVATAQNVLQALFEPPAKTRPPEKARRPVSRRDLFRSLLSTSGAPQR